MYISKQCWGLWFNHLQFAHLVSFLRQVLRTSTVRFVEAVRRRWDVDRYEKMTPCVIPKRTLISMGMPQDLGDIKLFFGHGFPSKRNTDHDLPHMGFGESSRLLAALQANDAADALAVFCLSSAWDGHIWPQTAGIERAIEKISEQSKVFGGFTEL